MEYDSVPERFTPHDLAILYPQHTCIARQATPDYHITLIVVSADLFCLSPMHFSSVVKQQTGHTAGYWIQHYLVIQLKQTLTYEPETSIQAIADRFGFSEQASFARYFKKHTGVTPTEYREVK